MRMMMMMRMEMEMMARIRIRTNMRIWMRTAVTVMIIKHIRMHIIIRS